MPILNAMTGMETVHVVPEGSLARSSSRTSTTKLPVNAGAHAEIEDVTNMSFSASNLPCSLLGGCLVATLIVKESIQQRNSGMFLEHILPSVMYYVPDIIFKASHAIGEMFKIEDECKDQDVRAITS